MNECAPNPTISVTVDTGNEAAGCVVISGTDLLSVTYRASRLGGTVLSVEPPNLNEIVRRNIETIQDSV